MAGPSKFAPKWEGPLVIKETPKWVLSSSPDGWQGPNGSHQWEVAKALLCLS